MNEKDELLHYGVKRRSGRYPWGSGEDPYQHESIIFLSKVDSYREKGLSNTEIAREMGISRKELENEITLANKRIKQSRIDQAKTMKEDGHSNQEIAERLGISEASVRNYLNPKSSVRAEQMDNLVQTLKDQVKEKPYLDVGKGTEYQLAMAQQMGVSKQKLDAALQQLEHEGYFVHTIYIRDLYDQNKYTTMKVLTKEKDSKVVYENSEKIRAVTTWTEDGGTTWQGIKDPISVDWDRVAIRYGDKGGTDKDGTIELRRGVEDLDMGSAHYAQARIKVGDTHYLKGMAFYSDDIPKGYDIIFNTNKKSGTPKEEVLKKLKDNPDNPFGAYISRQIEKNGKVTSAVNIVNQEGDWAEWGHTLSSQFLSKQPLKIIKERLDATYDTIKEDYDSIMTCKSPVVKSYLLEKFQDGCDKKARNLKAQGIAGEMAEVILPVTSMKPTEIYAPNYKNGTKVVLVRYPHGGIFELPELTVNNKQPEAKKMIANAIDAVGIHPSVAQKLSGADFDGDTVYVLPNNNKNLKIKTAPSLEGLKNFDPNIYHVSGDVKTISPKNKQMQMGIVSNLITDMTIHNASTDEIARAVRHSMVVIDSEKHNLDWKQSAVDNGIAALHTKYQGKPSGGAATLISRSKQSYFTDKDGNELKVKQVTETSKNGRKYKRTAYFNKETGDEVRNPIKKYRMDTVDDARKLSSGSAVEGQYANYINKVKALKTIAAKSSALTKAPSKDKEMAKLYSTEVKSLETKLTKALANSPMERQVQIQAVNQYYKKLTPGMEKDDYKKLATQVTAGARAKVGTKSDNHKIHITAKEYKAIENNALSPTKVRQILNFVDMEELRALATPTTPTSISSAKIARAKAMLNSGRTWEEISNALGIPVSTIRSVTVS